MGTERGISTLEKSKTENDHSSDIGIQDHVASFIHITTCVMAKPSVFFKNMPKTGVLTEPLVFLAVMGGIGSILQTGLAIISQDITPSFFVGLTSIIIGPIITVIYGLVISVILFFIWKLMGSIETVETAFRCAAFASATIPVITISGIFPYVGALIGIGWMTYLMVIASVEVHQLAAGKARMVFGIITGIFALISVSSQFAIRHTTEYIDNIQIAIGHYEYMSPEEIGEKVGKFLIGIQKGIGKR